MRINQTRRRLAAAAVTPIFVLALAACGGDDDNDSKGSDKESTSQSPSATESEAEQTEDADSEAPQVASEGDVDPVEFTRLVEDGLEKSEVGEYTMSMKTMGMEITAKGLMDYSGEQPATQMTMTMPGAGEIEMIMVDGFMYMKMPAAAGGGTGKWMKMDAEAALESQGTAGALDMRQALNAFVKGVEKVEAVGKEEVNGIESTHYKVTADSAAIAEMMGNSGAAAGAVEMPAKVTYDIWLDEQGRYSKMVTDLGDSGAVTMDITSWDSDAEIKAPPANQVQEMPAPTPAG